MPRLQIRTQTRSRTPRRHAIPAPLLVFALLVATARAQQVPAQPPTQTDQPAPSTYTLKVNSDLVLTNVVVRDRKTGQLVQGLTANDFTLLENGKPQHISTFDFESVDQVAPLNEATVSGSTSPLVLGKSTNVASPEQLRNHRLIVMFFDLASMQTEDIDRSVDAARNYINKQMQPADIVAVISLANSLSLDQDFTSDKKALLAAVGRYNGTEGSGFQQGANATSNQVEDASAFTPDESEYNDINTDRELFAISTIARSVGYINQKKSMLYFSGGLTRDGIENQASLRAATNAAVRANLSIYSVDSRGLQAISPLGDASTGSLRGTASFNGSAVQNNFDSNFNSQETLATLSADTGGKAFFDSNDFAPAFQRLQQDTSAYYVLGFRSTNSLRDGRYRKLSVKVNRADVKLEFRPGYYAPADYQHSSKEDRERQLGDELDSDLPATDVAVYLQALYFRLDETHYFIPISIVVPGSQIPFVKGGDRDKATLDIIGDVKDSAGHPIGNARDTVKLAIDSAQQVKQKNIQYSTGFRLPIGKYHLKFVVRENETGRMGSFETDINVPDQRKTPVKLSSVVMASQRVPNTSKHADSPLVRDGVEWVPNVAHVFRPDQHLYLLYEVYAPARAAPGTSTPAAPTSAAAGADPSAPAPTAKPAKGSAKTAKGQPAPVRVLSSIEFLSGSVKVYETPLVQATEINVPGRDAVAFQLDVPLSELKAGLYTCQVNVIDDAGGSFTFPRSAVLIKPADAAPQPPATPPATPAAPGR